MPPDSPGCLVLGLDPGTAITGYGLVRLDEDGALIAVGYGVITTPAGQPLQRRLQTIFHRIGDLVDKYRPTEAAVEKLFFSRNVTTAISVSHARGVALLALAEAGLRLYEYTPNEVKQTVAGYGGADKVQMQEMVRLLLGLDELPRPDDAADALAVAVCHLQHVGFDRVAAGGEVI